MLPRIGAAYYGDTPIEEHGRTVPGVYIYSYSNATGEREIEESSSFASRTHVDSAFPTPWSSTLWNEVIVEHASLKTGELGLLDMASASGIIDNMDCVDAPPEVTNCEYDDVAGGVIMSAAALMDELTFNIPGATDTTVTTIGIEFDLSGNWAADSDEKGFSDVRIRFLNSIFTYRDSDQMHDNSALAMDLWFGGGGYGCGSSALSGFYGMVAPGFLGSNAPCSSDFSSYRSAQWNSTSNGQYIGTVTLVGAHPTAKINMYLASTVTALGWIPYDAADENGLVKAIGTQEANLFFNHTGAVKLNLPANITYTSASGLFLTEESPGSSSVPEPTSFALLGLGLAGLGVMRWRKTA